MIDSAPCARRRVASVRTHPKSATRLGLAANLTVIALAFCLPFETTGGLSIGGLRLTSVEILLALALAAGAAALAADRERRARLSAIPLTWALLLGGFALSAVVSGFAAAAFSGTAVRAAA